MLVLDLSKLDSPTIRFECAVFFCGHLVVRPSCFCCPGVNGLHTCFRSFQIFLALD